MNVAKTVEITVVEGCTCPESTRWFNRCRVAQTVYNALPLNWRDVADGEAPDAVPCVESVTDIIRQHPHGRLIYLGGNTRIMGGGHDGSRTLHTIAVEAAL